MEGGQYTITGVQRNNGVRAVYRLQGVKEIMEREQYTGGQRNNRVRAVYRGSSNNGVRAVYTLMEGGPRAVFRESNK